METKPFKRQDYPAITEPERQLLLEDKLDEAVQSYFSSLSFLGISLEEAKEVILHDHNRLALFGRPLQW